MLSGVIFDKVGDVLVGSGFFKKVVVYVIVGGLIGEVVGGDFCIVVLVVGVNEVLVSFVGEKIFFGEVYECVLVMIL